MDAWRSVTRIAVREARLKEIRQEILNSSKLQAHLADNPKVSMNSFNKNYSPNVKSNDISHREEFESNFLAIVSMFLS